MCERTGNQQTDRPKMDAGEIETGKTAGREKPTAGKTATRTKQVRTDCRNLETAGQG